MNTTDTDTFDHLARVSDERVRLVRRVAPHTVALGAGRRRFTALLWRAGLIVTADEAMPEKGDVHALDVEDADGGRRAVPASIVGRDASTDIALLRLPDGAGAGTGGGAGSGTGGGAGSGAGAGTGGGAGDGDASGIGPFATDTPEPGASVTVVAAGADGPVVAHGTVASVGPEWRSLRGGRIDARVELDVRLPRVAEGAPVFDARGAALGMAVTGPRRRALLIPGTTIDRVAAALERDGRIARGRIGAALQSIALDGGGRGLVVASVEADGPAARAGLHQGDLVVAIDGRAPGALRGLMARLGPGSVGTTLALTVRRGGEDRDVGITIEERPEERHPEKRHEEHPEG